MARTAAGSLDQRITLQRKTGTADGMGGHTEVWADIGTQWAKVMPAGGNERVEAMRMGAATAYRMTVRWRGDADGQPYFRADDKVIWRGREYAVRTVTPIGRQAYIELLTEEGGPS